MHGIYKFSDYKEFLQNFCEVNEITFSKVAEAARVHRQYLTQVFKQKAHLSEEQAFHAGSFLGLAEEELDYFLLLVREAKTGVGLARNYLAKKRQEIQKKKAQETIELPRETVVVPKPAGHDFMDYYLDLKLQLCHAYLFLPRYQQDLPALAQALRLSSEALEIVLRKLETLDLAAKDKHGWTSRTAFLHLEKGSTLSTQNHRNWRLLAANLPVLDQDANLFFSTTVISEEKVKLQLMAQLRKVLAQFHKSLPPTKNEEVFQVNVDVFGLTSRHP